MRPNRPNPARSKLWRLLAPLIAMMVAVPAGLCQTGPTWWYNSVFTTTGTVPAVRGTANDYAAVNQGQVKNLAVTAVNELNVDLAQFG